MSSAQVSQVERSNKVSAKHATKLNELLNEMATQPAPQGRMAMPISARCEISGSGKNQEVFQALPKCIIVNYTPSHVSHQGDKSWHGSVEDGYPIRIARNAFAGFRHSFANYSEGAVLYVSTYGYSDIAFILAWENTHFRKLVYVEAGAYENYEGQNWWDEIRMNLKLYGGTQSYYKDYWSGAEVSAQIGNGTDFIAAAAFDITTSN